MTSFGKCHSDRVTVRSDEESTVYTSHVSGTRSTYWRSSRRSFHSLLDGSFRIRLRLISKASIKEFHQLVSLTVTTPLRMTSFRKCHSDRSSEESDEESTVYIISTKKLTHFRSVLVSSIFTVSLSFVFFLVL